LCEEEEREPISEEAGGRRQQRMFKKSKFSEALPSEYFSKIFLGIASLEVA